MAERRARNQQKEYLGDGCYVVFDGYALIVTTENGERVTNEIVFEPAVWYALEQYVARLRGS